jgi:hypothetical protein
MKERLNEKIVAKQRTGKTERNGEKQRENGVKGEPPRGSKGVKLLWKTHRKTVKTRNKYERPNF